MANCQVQIVWSNITWKNFFRRIILGEFLDLASESLKNSILTNLMRVIVHIFIKMNIEMKCGKFFSWASFSDDHPLNHFMIYTRTWNVDEFMLIFLNCPWKPRQNAIRKKHLIKISRNWYFYPVSNFERKNLWKIC